MCNCWLLSLAYYSIVTYTHKMPWCALLTAVKNYNKSLEKLQDFFFKTETNAIMHCLTADRKQSHVTRLNQSQSDQLSPVDYTYPIQFNWVIVQNLLHDIGHRGVSIIL